MRHRLAASLSYVLPFTANNWVSDWQLQAVVTIESGRPFTVAVHPDIDASNTGRSNLGFGYNDRPNVTGDPSLIGVGSFGDALVRHRRLLDARVRHVRQLGPEHTGGPGFRSLNLAVIKLIPLGGVRLQGRFEVFNLFNTTNLESARRVPRVADVRPDSLSAGAAADSDGDKGAFLILVGARGWGLGKPAYQRQLVDCSGHY